MTSGKEWQRDKLYGRRAGRWAGPSATELVSDLHGIRLEAIRRDVARGGAEKLSPQERAWPIESYPIWRAVAKDPEHPAYPMAIDVVRLIGP